MRQDRKNTYFFGLHLVSSDDYRYVLNAHGDVVALVNASVNVVRRYEYDAFGVELNPDETDTNPYRYCAEYFDIESGTIYLRARYYNPAYGRFTQPDPHWNVGNRIYGDPDNTKADEEQAVKVYLPDILAIRQSGNLYVYCMENPVAYFDSTGHLGTLATIAIGAGVGALVSAGFKIFENVVNGEKWTTGLGSALLSGAVSGAISFIPIPGASNFVQASVMGAAGNLVGQMIAGEINSGEDVVIAVGLGVSAGLLGEAIAESFTIRFKAHFAKLTRAEQKGMLSKIGKITNRELKEIRKALKNDLPVEKLDELISKYGYDKIVSAFVSSTTATVEN